MNQEAQLFKDMVAEMIEEDKKVQSGEIEDHEELDRKHTEALKPILAGLPHKWPTLTTHGEELCHWVWILVQHSDHDLQFQKDCLDAVNKLFAEHPEEVIKQDLAYLTDRIMVKTTNQQKYGTQWQDFESFVVLRPLIDKDSIDSLRKEMGLTPLADYQATAQQVMEIPAFLTMEDANNAGFIPTEVVAQEILRQLGNQA